MHGAIAAHHLWLVGAARSESHASVSSALPGSIDLPLLTFLFTERHLSGLSGLQLPTEEPVLSSTNSQQHGLHVKPRTLVACQRAADLGQQIWLRVLAPSKFGLIQKNMRFTLLANASSVLLP